MSVLPTSNEGAEMKSIGQEPLYKPEATEGQHCGCGCGCPCCEPTSNEPISQTQHLAPDDQGNDGQVSSSPSDEVM